MNNKYLELELEMEQYEDEDPIIDLDHINSGTDDIIVEMNFSKEPNLIDLANVEVQLNNDERFKILDDKITELLEQEEFAYVRDKEFTVSVFGKDVINYIPNDAQFSSDRIGPITLEVRWVNYTTDSGRKYFFILDNNRIGVQKNLSAMILPKGLAYSYTPYVLDNYK